MPLWPVSAAVNKNGKAFLQEEGLKRYAAQAGGEIVKFFKVAETASEGEQRKTFRELIGYMTSDDCWKSSARTAVLTA